MLFIISGSAVTLNGFTRKPQDVLMRITGAQAIPAIGFHKKIGEATRVNTVMCPGSHSWTPPTSS
ncbi:hypothetical protein DPMN_014032 [Dreissena polymorpha]|uniref:Uncharacterized protein n=1 Tax=Dreissena polymorpha TaxID=45954 RepID=A0A9D4S468_DREPO|nr:hypothetical protein DPMN_014032 [Dreissena polymorpha]